MFVAACIADVAVAGDKLELQGEGRLHGSDGAPRDPGHG